MMIFFAATEWKIGECPPKADQNAPERSPGDCSTQKRPGYAAQTAIGSCGHSFESGNVTAVELRIPAPSNGPSIEANLQKRSSVPGVGQETYATITEKANSFRVPEIKCPVRIFKKQRAYKFVKCLVNIFYPAVIIGQ